MTQTTKPTFVGVQSGPDAARAYREWNPPNDPPRSRSNATSNHASTLGDICERRLAYRRTVAKKAEPISPGLRSIFRTGTEVTPIVLNHMNEFGRQQAPQWEILERESKIEDRSFLREHNIGCYIDGVRHVADATGRLRAYNVVEFKTVNSNVHPRIKTLDDVGVTQWMAKAPDQLMLGMFGRELVEHPGWLILINKESIYDITIIEVPFDYARVERLLVRAKSINDHVANGTLPRQICRPDTCPKCEFVMHCAPRLEADPADAVVVVKRDDDTVAYDTMVDELEDFDSLEEGKKRFDAIKKRLKGKLVPGQRIVYGQWLVDWKVHGKGWRMSVIDTSMEASQK